MTGDADDPPRRRSLRAKLLLCGASLVIALLLAELSVRALGIGAFHEPRRSFYGFKTYPGTEAWGFEPGADAWFSWAGDPYDNLPADGQMVVTLNEFGLRGAEPPAGYPATLFLGDSFTFGEGVPLDHTFVRRVESALEPEGRVCVNAGVPGFGTPQQAARLPTWLEDFRPKSVVLVFVLNDPIPFEDSKNRDGDFMKTSGREPSALRLVELFRGVARTGKTEEWYRSFYAGEREDAWARSRALIGDMHAMCTEANARFGVALFPLLHRVSNSPFAPLHEMVREACREMEIPYVDLTPALRDSGDSELWVHPADHHPSRRAHELVSRPLTDFVKALHQD